MKKDLFDVCLGSVLKDLRTQNNLSLQNVADKVGCTRQMIFYYESGRTPLTVVQLINICNVYNVYYVDVMHQAQSLMNSTKV